MDTRKTVITAIAVIVVSGGARPWPPPYSPRLPPRWA